jgi:thiaminase/transcriptional activator TenA
LSAERASSPREALQKTIAPSLQAILAHPFIVGLRDGTLAVDAFSRYLGQNFLYLTEYARSLALLASRSDADSDVEFFARRAAFALAGERDFVERLAVELDLPLEALRPPEPSPVCLAYASFVKQAVAYGSQQAALGAVLPCYLLYWETSKALEGTGSSDPRYQRWIDMYVDPSFEEGVLGALDAVDRACAGPVEQATEALVANAVVSARYEWMFWEAAYRGDDWPALV